MANENLRNTIVMLVVSLTAFPISYVYNNTVLFASKDIAFILAMMILCTIVGINKLLMKKVKDWTYYGFALFSFTCVIDLVICLEMLGKVSGFMSWYLANGEPYLASTWGYLSCFWDMFGFCPLYIVLCFYSSKGLNYRTTALYWGGGIFQSVVNVLLGACLSKCGLQWCTLLNAPYIIFPFFIVWRCLTQEDKDQSKKAKNARGVLMLVSDCILGILLFLAAFVSLIRGLVCLGSKQDIPMWYGTEVEPILLLEDPAPFYKIQGLFALFLLVPSYCLLMFGLATPLEAWVKNVAALTAGASMTELTFIALMLVTMKTRILSPLYCRNKATCHSTVPTAMFLNMVEVYTIAGSMLWLTPPQYGIPNDAANALVYWVCNLIVLIAPHLVFARTFCSATRTLEQHNNAQKKNH